MTEITRVPLPPIAKGALTKLWIGVAAVALAAGGLAYATLPPSVDVETIKAGTGVSPTIEDVALINYKGSLASGKVFDEGKNAVFPLQGVIPGFTQALTQMQKGGKYKVEIPSELAYGPEDQKNPQTGAVEIPGGSDLTFEIELIDFRNRAEIEAQQRMMQQLQQQMQGAGGPPGAGAPPPGAPAPKQ
ncbi:MAG: FKBP-type peptidyl-prolyl cis-trans isomerase [Novosphingobium sp.]